LSEILPVNCKFIRDSIPILSDKTQTLVPELSGFKDKKERYKYSRNYFGSLKFDFFEFNSSLRLEYGHENSLAEI